MRAPLACFVLRRNKLTIVAIHYISQKPEMTRLIPDRFVMLLLATLALAWVVPVRGDVLELAQNAIFVGIFLLFFLHGLRLPCREVVRATRSWKLQGAMLGFSFLVFPLAGWLLATSASVFLPTALVAGLIYLAILPSTVQSAISYSSIAGGNIAASVVGAAVSNLAAIILTPLLAALLIVGASGIGMDSGVIKKIATMLLLPFALGQIAQHWLGSWAANQKKLLSFFDRGVILLAVYIAFAGAVASGALIQLDTNAAFWLFFVLLILLIFAFATPMLIGKLLGLERQDRISLIFASAHKSIATGAPLAAILFGPDAGLILLPAIIYHMAQLILSAPLATRLSRG